VSDEAGTQQVDEEAQEETDYYLDANERSSCRDEILSPSGLYRLLIRTYPTRPGVMDVSRGTVYRVSDGVEIADVRRNYSYFLHAWIENHHNGHAYLLCGADYQGQTVIELDTAKRRDHLPPEAEDGIAYCWMEPRFYPDASIVVAAGCIWACPYEFRLYDFTNPMAGWPELSVEPNEGIDCDRQWPRLAADGTFRCFQSVSQDVEDEEDGNTADVASTAAIKTFRRDGAKLVLVEEWVSEAEKGRRQAGEEGRLKHQAWLKEFRATDPLYLKYIELLADPALSPEKYESYGRTYDKWCPDFQGDETRWCRRIAERKNDYTIDFEWAVLTGPVKLVIYKGGKHQEDKFFEHSIAGMVAAFDHAKALLAN